jgi:hypothetical protein
MTRKLVFVHGRAQENKDPVALRKSWIHSLKSGLAKSNLSLPVAEADIRLPYYGDELAKMANGADTAEKADVLYRGAPGNQMERNFKEQMLEEFRRKANITEEQLRSVSNDEVIRRGPQHWEWVQSILKAFDRYVPGMSDGTIALLTNDVYCYLKNIVISEKIDDIVLNEIDPAEETVLVSHSLGTVVAYGILRRNGEPGKWKIPQFVTVGSPLAVTAIRDSFMPLKHPSCVGQWFNAMDDRDVVALYPLDGTHFGIAPPIENKTDVVNFTDNRHGIEGYLSDKVVAQRIHAALIAP